MMRVVLAVVATSVVACGNVQDLGNDRRAPEPAAAEQHTVLRPITFAATKPEPNPMSCPSSIPVETTACSDVAWCAYPLDGATGLAVMCGCSLGHWSCLRVRDDHRANPVPVADLPLTIASCTDGASCEQGTKCKVGLERWCECTSNSRLRCVRPNY
jgi:hypothetical protein